MKICAITASLSRENGWGRYSSEIIGELAKYNDVKIITSRSSDITEYKGCEVISILPDPLSIRLSDYISTISKLKHEIAGCEIAHCFTEPYSPLTAISSILSGRPYVLHAVGTYAAKFIKSGVYGKIFRYAYAKAGKIICISNFTCQSVLKEMRLENTIVIPLGVDYRHFERCRPERMPESDSKILLSVGAIKPRKGYDVSIQAFAMAKKEIDNMKYIIAGDVHDDKYFTLLKRIISENKLGTSVEFLGKVSESKLIELFYGCDAFILTPVQIGDSFEGFGLVYLEANACGKPVIASASGGVPDAVIHNQTGILVPERDVQATANAIIELMSDEKLLKRLGDKGKEWAKKMSWENTARKIMGVYEEVLGK